jgi:hypothetical protein
MQGLHVVPQNSSTSTLSFAAAGENVAAGPLTTRGSTKSGSGSPTFSAVWAEATECDKLRTRPRKKAFA